MRLLFFRATVGLWLAFTAASLAQELPVTAGFGKILFLDPKTKQLDLVLDPKAIYLENECLKAGICTGQNAGQIMDLVYKPMNLQLANQLVPMGYCRERYNAEGLPEWVTPTNIQTEIIEQGGARAVAKVSYEFGQPGTPDGATVARSALRSTKTYTLTRGAACLIVRWKLENVGQTVFELNPWLSHVGGHLEKSLAGLANNRLLQPEGPVNLGHERWADPVTDWTARTSGPTNSEELPMVCSITDFRQVFQHLFWQRSPRFTLQTIYSRIALKPGESWQTDYVIAAMPNLGNVTYVAPELAASVDVADEPLQPGREARLTVNIAAAMELGEKCLKGRVLDANDRPVLELPERPVRLTPGKIARLDYRFTPPSNGVYRLSLALYAGPDKLPLGKIVGSQQDAITLPLVVGPPPAVVIPKWQNDGFAWARRKAREVKPWRTLVNNAVLKAGQILVPDRIFLEDTLLYEDALRPAFIRLAGGEYECLQFAIEIPAPADPMALEVGLSALRNGEGAALEKAEVREQIYLTTETPSYFLGFPIGQWPDPLFESDWEAKIPNAPIAQQNIAFIKKGHKRVYWVTVRAQPDARPGLYKGAVTLTLAGKPAGEFPVEVKVNAFVLPRRATLRCSTGMVGWHGNGASNWEILGLPAEAVKTISKNARDQYWRLILEYGWTPTMFLSGVTSWEEYKNVGRGLSVFPSGKSKGNEAWLITNNVINYAYIYAPFDEHTDQKIPEVVAWAKAWKQESKIPILDCYYGAKVEELFGFVDVWLGQSPKSPWWGKPTPPLGWGDKAVARKQAGDQFFSCNANLIWHVEFVPAECRSEFWNDFAVGVDGRYVYSTCRWTEDVYKKNWTSGNYMGCVVYPGPHGITTSIRLETLRDAVEDYDYLALLRERVRRIDNSRQMPAGPIEQAKAILEDPKLAEKVNTTITLHEMRNRLADLIEQLGL
ncbi:MAG: DUF4091 domain-containing protein [bacterium]